MRSPSAGGCDFDSASVDAGPNAILWTASALPSVVTLTNVPESSAAPSLRLSPRALQPLSASGPGAQIIERGGLSFRVEIDDAADPPAALLPFDELFEIRVQAALRLWRSLTNRKSGPDPARLSLARRERLILALRAVDARVEHATYREIADGLFGHADVSARAWKGHDLRGRTIRLVRFGSAMMQGGYRRLLLHPYRRRA
jgi:hypothetical protein